MIRKERIFMITGTIIRTLIICGMLLYAVGVPLSAAPVAVGTCMSAQEMRAVKSGRILTRVYLKHNGAGNVKQATGYFSIPATPYTAGIRGWEMLAEEKAYIPASPDMLQLYNSLLGYSSYAGMHYYSVTDRAMKPFIREAYTIASPGSVRRVRDSRAVSITPSRNGYFRIRDNRLGWLTFKGELFYRNGVFIAKNYSVTPVTRYGVTISRKGEYRMITFLFPDGPGGYYLYSVHALRIRSEVMLKSGFLNSESFANRIRAATVHTAKLLGRNWIGKIIAAQ